MKNISTLLGLLGIATVRHNTQQNGVEVVFSERPTDEPINFLKQNGFRWSSAKKLWYAKYSQNLMDRVSKKLDAPTEPRPEPPKPTQEQIIAEKANSFEAMLAKKSWLKDAYFIVQQGLANFINNPRTVWIEGMDLQYDKAKKDYQHLPSKRKRPDHYSPIQVFNLFIHQVLKHGGVIDWKTIHQLEPMRTLWDMEYKIKNNPQQSTAPNTEAFHNYLTDKDKYLKAEDERWQAWFEANGQNFKKAYIQDKGVWKEVSIKKLYSPYADSRRDVVETQRGEGWIIVVGGYPVDKVYIEPDGKSLIEAYPQLIENTYTVPKLEDYLTGKILVKHQDPTPIPEKIEQTPKLKLSDIPAEVKKMIPKHQLKVILGSEEHFDVIERLKKQVDKAAKIQEKKVVRLMKLISDEDTNNANKNLQIAHLHYFYGGSDWFVTEITENDLVFGYAILNSDYVNSEWGYTSIDNLVNNGRVELDFYWTPKTIAKALYKISSEDYPEPKDLYTKYNIDFETQTIKETPKETPKPSNLKLKLKLKAKALKLKLTL